MSASNEPTRGACAEERWPPRYLTVSEAAEAMSRKRSAVLRLIRTGQLRSIRLGRTYRIRETEMLRYMAAAQPGPVGALDAAECARILRCPENMIRAMVKLGHLKGSGGDRPDSCLVTVSEFRRFLRDVER